MRKIIVLEKQPNPNEVVFDYIFWLDVPTNYQPFYANADATSQYKNATTEEIDAIKAGQVYELAGSAVFSKTDTVADIKSFLVAKFNREQTIINNKNPWIYYGTYYDGSSWTNRGVN